MKRFIILSNNIDKVTILYLDFWRELVEESPDPFKIFYLGSEII